MFLELIFGTDHQTKIMMHYLSNRPHFPWVYRHDKPRGMLGEHEKSL